MMMWTTLSPVALAFSVATLTAQGLRAHTGAVVLSDWAVVLHE